MRVLWIILLLILSILIIFAGLMAGSPFYSPAELFSHLSHPASIEYISVIDLRLPRILQAFLSGSVLTLGGFFMQALIRNPLADPYIMGLSAGAGTGVNLLYLGLIPLAGIGIWIFPAFAMAGGMAALFLLMLIAWRTFYKDSVLLLIAGVAISSFFMTLNGFMIYKFADADQVRQVVFWTFGSFNRSVWEAVWVSVGCLGVALVFGWMISSRLDILILGEAQARTLGINTSATRLMILLIASATVGGTIAFTGPIGFVGMIVPHFIRAIHGVNHKKNLILGALGGGIYLSTCQVLNVLIFPPAGIPIGIITSMLGVPFFLYILFVRNRGFL